MITIKKPIFYNAVRTLGIVLSLIVLSSVAIPSQARALGDLYMEDMTWMEIRDRIAAGASIAIIPTGGVEQNGPQMVTNKHNYIVRYTAGDIARRLGNALVAPVVPFSPSGRINPPEGHMQFAGTISVSPETFSMLLMDVASSLKQNGFRTIAIIGDHGGSQDTQKRVAEKLNAEWSGSGVRVIHVSDYYDKNNGQDKWGQSIGVKVPNPGVHAGFFDTSELMTARASAVRSNKLGVRADKDYKTTGAMGDSTKATANYGRRLLSLKVEAAVAQIQNTASGAR